MQDDDHELTIDELAGRVGVPVRTIRYYIAEGLLPGPGSRGKAATYGAEHLLRLSLIRRLSEQRVPLVEIRDRLSRLSLDEVRTLLAEEDRRAAELQHAQAAMSPKEYVSALLKRAQASRSAKQTAEPTATYSPSAPAPLADVGPPAPSLPLARPAEVWHRWELAPGVELHVRADAESRYRTLIERLLKIAGVSVNHLL